MDGKLASIVNPVYKHWKIIFSVSFLITVAIMMAKHMLLEDDSRTAVEAAFHFEVKPSGREGVNRFELYYGDEKASYRMAMEGLADGTLGRLFTSTILAETSDRGWEAVFWECKPAKRDLFDSQVFEFVLLNAPSLAAVSADSGAFREHFLAQHVTVFPNLGKDATLVVPCPGSKTVSFTHLLAFLSSAPEIQLQAFWQAVGSTFTKRMSGKMQWLSTSGLGVYWLHVRIEDRPKYYNFQEYKDMVH